MWLFKPTHLSQMDMSNESISKFRGVGLFFSFFFLQILIEHSVANSEDPDLALY